MDAQEFAAAVPQKTFSIDACEDRARRWFHAPPLQMERTKGNAMFNEFRDAHLDLENRTETALATCPPHIRKHIAENVERRNRTGMQKRHAQIEATFNPRAVSVACSMKEQLDFLSQ
jgi:hypothetical protein